MSNLSMGISPGSRGTRVIAMAGPGDTIMKARLSREPSHPRALATLLEAIALWQGEWSRTRRREGNDVSWIGGGNLAVGCGMGPSIKIKVTDKQREELGMIVARPSESAGLVRRARVVLLSDAGVSGREVARRLDLTPQHVSVIRARFRADGVAGLAERPKAGRKDHAVSAQTEARIVQMAMSPPPAGRSRWTTRLLGKQAGLSAECVSNLLQRNGLKPHLVRTYKVSRDPDFASKVKDVVGLYLNPPEHAVVLSVDEKTSIQALERTQLPLPLRSGRASRHTHDYKRHGVLDLYAALEIATGNVTHRVTESHTATDFLGFMNTVVRRYPRKQLHVVLDNSSSHSTPEVTAWLAAHPRVHFHYTPTSASWLNQVEGFFGILGKQSLAATDFYSKTSLREHLHAYMRAWNRNPTPFAWTKPAAAIIKSHRRMLKRISVTVHSHLCSRRSWTVVTLAHTSCGCRRKRTSPPACVRNTCVARASSAPNSSPTTTPSGRSTSMAVEMRT